MRTDPFSPWLSKQTEMRHNPAKDLHHMHPVVDEVSHPQLSTDRGLVLPLQAETHTLGLHAGSGLEINGLHPVQGSLCIQSRVRSCMRGPAFETIHTWPSQAEQSCGMASKAPSRVACSPKVPGVNNVGGQPMDLTRNRFRGEIVQWHLPPGRAIRAAARCFRVGGVTAP